VKEEPICLSPSSESKNLTKDLILDSYDLLHCKSILISKDCDEKKLDSPIKDESNETESIEMQDVLNIDNDQESVEVTRKSESAKIETKPGKRALRNRKKNIEQ